MSSIDRIERRNIVWTSREKKEQKKSRIKKENNTNVQIEIRWKINTNI